jgi:hypothetical protein
MNPFLRAIDALNKHDVRYVIVGGFAAIMHGHNRATKDLDIVVDLETAEARKAIAALVSIGMQPRVPVDPYDFALESKRKEWMRDKNAVVFTMIDPVNSLFVVDIFIELPMEFEPFYNRAKVIQLKNQPVKVCSVDDLIIMKTRSGRPQDLLDIEVLNALRSGKRAL